MGIFGILMAEESIREVHREKGELEKKCEGLLNELGVDTSKNPPDESKIEPVATLQAAIIEGLCNLGRLNERDAFVGLTKATAALSSGAANAIARVQRMLEASKAIVRAREKQTRPETEHSQTSLAQLSHSEMERRLLLTPEQRYLESAWGTYCKLNLSAEPSASKFFQTHLSEGVVNANLQDIEQAVTKALSGVTTVSGKFKAINESYLPQKNLVESEVLVSLPLNHKDSGGPVIKVYEARSGLALPLDSKEAEVLVVKKVGNGNIDIPDKGNIPLIIYIEEVDGYSVITCEANHNAADGVHAALLTKRISHNLGLKATESLPDATYQKVSKYVTEQVSSGMAKSKFGLEFGMLSEAEISSLASVLSSKMQLEGKEVLTLLDMSNLIIQDLLAYETGAYQLMGVLAYNKNIDVRLSHLRRDAVFSLAHLCRLIDEGKIEEAKKLVHNFRSQSRLKTGFDNMALIQAATSYMPVTQRAFNGVTKNPFGLLGGMEKVVGPHQGSIIPTSFLEKLYKEGEPHDADLYGISFGGPALAPVVQEAAATCSQSGGKLFFTWKHIKKA